MDLGDRLEDSALYFTWDSNDGDGASITRAADGTISVYKDDGVVQSVAGITDTEDFDGLTGVHNCKIDLSADAFYATGHDYSVVLSAATIDGQTVNATLATFSIENRFAEVDVTKWNGTAVATPDTAGYPKTTIKDGAGAGEIALTNGKIDEVSALTGHTVQTGDSFARLGAPAGASIAADLVTIDNFVDDLESRLTAARAGYLDELAAANLPADIDTLLGRITAAVALASVCTEGRLAVLADLAAAASTMVTGAAEAGTLSTTQMTSDLGEGTNDHYNGRIVIWTSGVLLGQASDITDYNGADGMLTYTAVTEAPGEGDTFVIV